MVVVYVRHSEDVRARVVAPNCNLNVMVSRSLGFPENSSRIREVQLLLVSAIQGRQRIGQRPWVDVYLVDLAFLGLEQEEI